MKITVLCETNKAYCDDSAGTAGAGFWVIDGATGCYKNRLAGYPSDANWYAGTINGYFERNLSDTSRTLSAIAADAAKFAGEQYARLTAGESADPDAYPCATVAAARINSDRLETFLIGDCSIVFSSAGKITAAHDERGHRFEEPLIRDMHEYIISTGCRVGEAREHFAARFRGNRSYKNKEDGFYVLEFDPQAATHAVTGTYPAADVDELLLATDGFYRAADVFGICDGDAGLLEAVRSSGLPAVFSGISDREKSDPDCRKYPRTKQFDDCSAVFMTK
jgi:hypothetical protein